MRVTQTEDQLLVAFRVQSSLRNVVHALTRLPRGARLDCAPRLDCPRRRPPCRGALEGRRKSGGLQTLRLPHRPAGAVARSDRPR
eukprot:2478838-Prymnesium_polylepis.1